MPIVYPFLKILVYMIECNLLKNCPVNKAEILSAEDLFVPDLGSLKVKTTRSKTKIPTTNNNTHHDILKVHGNIILYSDIVVINRVAFMPTVSRYIQFRTWQHLKNAIIPSFYKELTKM